MKNNYIAQGWLILLLAALFGAALAGVQVGLSGRIEANKLADTMDQIPVLVPGAVDAAAAHYGDLLVYRAIDETGDLAGWVITASGQGFADRIEALVGVDAGVSQITGIYILAQNETPGLGNLITDAEAFRDQFAGKSTMRRLVVAPRGSARPENEKIDSLTGATISSQSCVDIVNRAVAAFKTELARKQEGGAP